jgi:hypothetical protein
MEGRERRVLDVGNEGGLVEPIDVLVEGGGGD